MNNHNNKKVNYSLPINSTFCQADDYNGPFT